LNPANQAGCGKSRYQYGGPSLSDRSANLTISGYTLYKNPGRKVDYDAVYLAYGGLPNDVYVRASLSYDGTNGPCGLQARLRNIGVRFNGNSANCTGSRQACDTKNLICR
jgi:hypothetical protein